jgi:hypothetical protein
MEVNPLIEITIFEWINKQKYNTHKITDLIYQDDKCDYALFKIKNFLKITSNIYGWKDDFTVMDFEINPIWKGYRINPFNVINKDTIQKSEQINYIENSSIVNTKIINIVSSSNIDKNIQKYFFYNKKIQISDEKTIKELYLLKPKLITTHLINRYELNGKISMTNLLSFDILFNDIDFGRDCIIWMKDQNKTMYKLLKNTNISLKSLQNINNEIIDKETFVILYGHDKHKRSIIRCNISIDGIIKIDMNLHNRDKIIFDNIPVIKHIDDDLIKISKHLGSLLDKNYVPEKIILKEGFIKSILYVKYNKSLTILKKNLNLFPTFFEVKKEFIIYKRSSSNNNKDIDEITYIKNRLNDNISTDDIINELLVFLPQETKESILETIKNINNIDDEFEKKTFKQDGTIFRLELNKTNELTIHINNITKIELQYFLFWFLRIINIKDIQQPILPKSEKNINNDDTQNNVVILSNKDEQEVGLSSSSDGEGGGGKNNNNAHIKFLQDKDTDLFNNEYARQCQQDRQPMVMDTEKFIREKHSTNVDNFIEYGSNPNKLHTYFCPRWWCPDTETPLKNNDDKCPGENEVKINFYSNSKNTFNDPTIPKYVNLMQKTNKPCCYVKINGINSNTTSKLKEDIIKNILTNMEPIPLNRLGTLPKNIHDFLLENVKSEECGGTLTKKECYYRQGMKINIQKKSNLLSSLFVILEITKEKFIKEIDTKLTILDFLSLENGKVCKEFLNNEYDINYIYPKNSKKNKKNMWFSENIILPDIIKDKLYNAYLNFIEYIKNDNINIQLLFSLISIIFNKILIVFSFQNNVSSIICPENTSILELINNLQDEKYNTIILFHHNETYEPIVYKSKNKESFISNLYNIPHVQKSLSLCKSSNNNNKIFNKIKNYYDWIDRNELINNTQFKFRTLLINSDLTISNIQLKSGIILIFDPLPSSYIKIFMKNFNIKFISLYDTLEKYNLYFVSFTKENLLSWSEKVKKIGLTYIKTDIIDLPIKYNKNAFLFYSSNTEINIILQRLFKKSKMFKDVYKNIMNNIDYIKNNKKIFLKSILRENKIYYSIILEELENAKYFFYTKMDFLNTNIIDSDKYWIFSGLSIINEIPDKISSIKNTAINIKEDYIIDNIPIENISLNMNIDMLNNNILKTLPLKWTQNNNIYKKMKYIHNEHYDKDSLYILFNELIKYKESNITIDEIKKNANILLKKSMMNKQLLKMLLSEQNIRAFFAKKINLPKSSTLSIVISTLIDKTGKEKENFCEELIKKNLFPNHLSINSISNLLQFSFLIMHKRASHYEQQIIKRNTLLDLARTTDFYPVNSLKMNKQPLIILFKDNNQYFVIKYENTIIYERFNDVPDPIKDLIKEYNSLYIKFKN